MTRQVLSPSLIWGDQAGHGKFLDETVRIRTPHRVGERGQARTAKGTIVKKALALNLCLDDNSRVGCRSDLGITL